jgi:hypothetical protein
MQIQLSLLLFIFLHSKFKYINPSKQQCWTDHTVKVDCNSKTTFCNRLHRHLICQHLSIITILWFIMVAEHYMRNCVIICWNFILFIFTEVVRNCPLCHHSIINSWASSPHGRNLLILHGGYNFVLDSLLDTNKHVDLVDRIYAFCIELLSEYNSAKISP